MDEKELQALQAQLSSGGQPQGQEDAESAKAQEEKRAAEAAMKRDLLATVLDSAARERLSRIALVAPQRSAEIESLLLRMAQGGQLRGRVTEPQLIDLLEQSEQNASKSGPRKKGAILYQRRKDFDDDDFDI